MNPPRVSVIIPCYNYARFLPEAVESVVAQTYREFEIIIVNDGSPDDTREVAEALIARHRGVSIRLINQENQGVAAARNKGIAASAGEYIVPLDADDVVMPEFLERLVPALDSAPEAGMAYSWTCKFGDVSELLRQGELTRKNLRMNMGPSCTSLIRRSAWEKAGGYNVVMVDGYEDWEFHISVFEAGYGSVVLPEVLFLYRKHGPSRIDGTQTHILRIYRDIKLLHPRLFKPVLSRLSVGLARAVVHLEHWTRDRVANWVYVNMPGLHKMLRHVKHNMLPGR